MCNLYREPSIDASYQVLVHLAKRCQRRRFFRNRPIRNKNWLWRPCLLTYQDQMSNHNRGPSIDASYQVLFIWPSGFRGEDFFRNRPIRNNNCLWRPCQLTDRKKMSNLQRTFHRCFLSSFVSFGQAVTEENIFRNQPIRKKNCLWWPCLLTNRDDMNNFIEDFPLMLPTKFWFIWSSGFRGE